MAFPSALAATRAAKERCPGAVCILGGNYATLNPEQAHATGAFDYVITGEWSKKAVVEAQRASDLACLDLHPAPP